VGICGELAGLRVEGVHDIGAEVGDPDGVALVDIHGIGAWSVPRQSPAFPAAVIRVVDRHLPRIPFRDPEPSPTVRPYAARSLVRGRRLDNAGFPALAVDPGQIAAGERHEIDVTAWSCGDPIRSRSLRGMEGLHLARRGIEPTVDSALPRKPEDAVAIESRGIEIGVTGVARKRPGPDCLRLRIEAHDCVEPAIGNPGRTVRTSDDTMRA